MIEEYDVNCFREVDEMRNMDKKLELFINSLKSEFKGNLRKIILFGSRARGDYDDESDYDFILIFNMLNPKIRKRLDDMIVDILIESGIVITDFALTEEQLSEMRYEPFIINAIKEGVVL
jgi:hypothetical protein